MSSSIEWTDETWNPVTGCTRVSPGCDNCYMFALYPRLRGMRVPGYELGPDQVQILPQRLELPLSWRKPRRVFVNSMADLFHSKVPSDFITDIFAVMERAGAERGHTFQVLTKRPGRAVGWWELNASSFPDGWPDNVWIGTSVETQKYAPRLTVLARATCAHEVRLSGTAARTPRSHPMARPTARSTGSSRAGRVVPPREPWTQIGHARYAIRQPPQTSRSSLSS